MMSALTPFQKCQVVISHKGCPDGTVAAWAVWRTLDQEYRDQLAPMGGFYASSSVPLNEDSDQEVGFKSKFIHPNSPEGAIALQKKGFPVVFVFTKPKKMIPLELVQGKHVLILDLDLGAGLSEIVKVAASVFVCDHHDSTYNTIRDHHLGRSSKFNCCLITDVTESAATLAWRLTHTQLAISYPYREPFSRVNAIIKEKIEDRSEIPPLVEVVRIGDTKQWNDFPKLKARAILQTLFAKNVYRSFESIERVYQQWSKRSAQWATSGAAALAYQQSLIHQAAKKCSLGYIQTRDGFIFTVAYRQGDILHSEIGMAMKSWATRKFKVPIDFTATWQYSPENKTVYVSLRDPSPGINLAQIAGNVRDAIELGGGHPNAASFSFYQIELLHHYIQDEKPLPSLISTLMSEIRAEPSISTSPKSSRISPKLSATVPSFYPDDELLSSF